MVGGGFLFNRLPEVSEGCRWLGGKDQGAPFLQPSPSLVVVRRQVVFRHPFRWVLSPDGLRLAPAARLGAESVEAEVLLHDLFEDFERGRRGVVPLEFLHLFAEMRVKLLVLLDLPHDLADDPLAVVILLVVRHRRCLAGLEAYFEREIIDEPGEVAVERAQQHLVVLQQRLDEEFLERLLGMDARVEVGPALRPADLQVFLGVFGGVLDELDRPPHELRGGGAGEGERDDLPRLGAEREETEDAERQLMGLAGAGGRLDQLARCLVMGNHGDGFNVLCRSCHRRRSRWFCVSSALAAMGTFPLRWRPRPGHRPSRPWLRVSWPLRG